MQSYNKTVWKNLPSTETSISAEKLNKLENAMEEVVNEVLTLSYLPRIRLMGCRLDEDGEMLLYAKSPQGDNLVEGETVVIFFERNVTITEKLAIYGVNHWELKGDYIPMSYKAGDVLVLYAVDNNSLTLDEGHIQKLKTELTASISDLDTKYDERIGSATQYLLGEIKKQILKSPYEMRATASYQKYYGIIDALKIDVEYVDTDFRNKIRSGDILYIKFDADVVIDYEGRSDAPNGVISTMGSDFALILGVNPDAGYSKKYTFTSQDKLTVLFDGISLRCLGDTRDVRLLEYNKVSLKDGVLYIP